MSNTARGYRSAGEQAAELARNTRGIPTIGSGRETVSEPWGEIIREILNSELPQEQIQTILDEYGIAYFNRLT